jgi:hypothetical protein
MTVYLGKYWQSANPFITATHATVMHLLQGFKMWDTNYAWKISFHLQNHLTITYYDNKLL